MPMTAGADLDPVAQRQLTDLRDLLVRWNERFNLTAIKDPDDICLLYTSPSPRDS